jgi:glycine cleavage system aminomethyltransferase T
MCGKRKARQDERAVRSEEIFMTSIPFAVPAGIAFDDDYSLWAVGRVAKLWDGDGWKAESMSWKESCYIHGGLSGPGQVRYTGPDASRFLESIFVNNFSRFKVGTAKHAIACNDQGLIVGHGVLQKLAENEYSLFVSGLWAPYQHSRTSLNVQQDVQNNFLFQIAGPTSRAAISAAAEESVDDVGFLRFRDITIAGHRCELMRIGMAGTLAYELHGPIADGPAVYSAILAAGRPHGIRQLGWKSYYVNHVEGGFPQQIWTFLPATYGDADFQSFARTAPTYRVGSGRPLISGSVDPADWRARYRTPQELGWGRSIQFDHDFTGRSALEREMSEPKRTIVTLEWNADDVMDIFASHLRDGPEFKAIEFPVTPQVMGIIGHADHVLKAGVTVGVSSGVVYSYYFRRILSHATVDIDQAILGNEVVVKWGDHGGVIKPVRATVARYPYLAEGRNQSA